MSTTMQACNIMAFGDSVKFLEGSYRVNLFLLNTAIIGNQYLPTFNTLPPCNFDSAAYGHLMYMYFLQLLSTKNTLYH